MCLSGSLSSERPPPNSCHFLTACVQRSAGCLTCRLPEPELSELRAHSSAHHILLHHLHFHAGRHLGHTRVLSFWQDHRCWLARLHSFLELKLIHVSSGELFKLGLKSRPLVTAGILGSSCTFLAQDLESAIFIRNLIFFFFRWEILQFGCYGFSLLRGHYFLTLCRGREWGSIDQSIFLSDRLITNIDRYIYTV